MQDEKCAHAWEMENIVPSFIITEKCSITGKVDNYMSFEQNPPMEQWREGEHIWNVVETAQSVRFDLKCTKCGLLVPYDELLGLMMCTGCDDKCDVNVLMRKLEPERTWVFVAFGFLPIDEKIQLTPEKIAFLEDYFNQRRKSSKSRIKIVSHELVKNISKCYAEVIKDVDMISLTPYETN